MKHLRLHSLPLFFSLTTLLFLQGCGHPSVGESRPEAARQQGHLPVAAPRKPEQKNDKTTGSSAVAAPAQTAAAAGGTGGRSSLMSSREDLGRRRNNLATRMQDLQKMLAMPTNENGGGIDAARIKKCQASVSGIVAVYDGLLTEMDRVQPPLQINADTMARLHGLFMQDLTLYDGDCLSIFAAAAAGPDADPKSASAHETLIDRLFHEGKMPELNALFDRLDSLKRDQLQRGRVRKVALSMSRTGRFREAATLFLKLSREDGESFSLPEYVQKAADLFYAAGDLGQAHTLYEKLAKTDGTIESRSQWAKTQLAMLAASGFKSPDMEAYRDLLQDFVRLDTSQDSKVILEKCDALQKRFFNSNGAQGAEKIRDAVRLRSQTRFSETFAQIDLLVSTGDLQGALALVMRMEQGDLDLEQGRQLAVKKQQVLKLTGSPPAAPQSLSQEELLKRLQDGMQFLQSLQYDKAIASVHQLFGTEHELKARELIQRAAGGAGEEQRKKAADYYVKAIKARDLGKKLELCMESRRLLKEILTKYPQANLHIKVNRHIEVVDRCIQSASGESSMTKNLKTGRESSPVSGAAAAPKAQPATK